MEVLLPSAQAAYGMTQGDVLPRLTTSLQQILVRTATFGAQPLRTDW